MLMVANVDWIFIAHRLPIAKEALKRGYKVLVLANDSGRADEITQEGIEFVNLPMSRSGVNPFIEFFVLLKMLFLYIKIKPTVVYHVTMKPVIYGSIISRFLRLNTVNAISGLGYNFTEGHKGLVKSFMIKLMRFGFNKERNSLIFENTDDLKELKNLKIVTSKNKVEVIKGVGADLIKFSYTAPIKKEKLIVLLATRMLWDKGVKEFVEVAKQMQEKYMGSVFFKLCGRIDKGNPRLVPESYLNSIKIEGYLEWFGYQEDIAEEYRQSDIVVLPSYREGMPTVLIEACAIGRPLVTTTAIGCRECVEEHWNGYKVPVKSIGALAEAIEKLILNKDSRVLMGINSRIKAEKEFDQSEVVTKQLDICDCLVNVC